MCRRGGCQRALLLPRAQAKADFCGNCDADAGNDCKADCRGAWGGAALEDACGKCGGDGAECADCAGTPNGLAKKDACGNCDTDPYVCPPEYY